MKPREYPERMLKGLVKDYELSADADVRAWGMEGRELAVEAGIFSAEVVKRALVGYKYEPEMDDYVYTVGNSDTRFVKEINAAAAYMKEKGWITVLPAGEGMAEDGVYSRLKPTSKGIDYAHQIMRPWYRKAWGLLKKDVRTIVVAIVTTIIITVLTNWVLGLLG